MAGWMNVVQDLIIDKELKGMAISSVKETERPWPWQVELAIVATLGIEKIILEM